MMNIVLKHIGKSAEDLRFFILQSGAHAGGITVHSIKTPSFSYGMAVAPAMRRRGVAKAALPLLYADMKQRGFRTVQVQIAPDNIASIALHRSLGFLETSRNVQQIVLTKAL